MATITCCSCSNGKFELSARSRISISVTENRFKAISSTCAICCTSNRGRNNSLKSKYGIRTGCCTLASVSCSAETWLLTFNFEEPSALSSLDLKPSSFSEKENKVRYYRSDIIYYFIFISPHRCFLQIHWLFP